MNWAQVVTGVGFVVFGIWMRRLAQRDVAWWATQATPVSELKGLDRWWYQRQKGWVHAGPVCAVLGAVAVVGAFVDAWVSSDDERDDRPDELLVAFHDWVRDEQITGFVVEVLSGGAIERTDVDLVKDLVDVTFVPDSTAAEQEAVRNRAQASPLVELTALESELGEER